MCLACFSPRNSAKAGYSLFLSNLHLKIEAIEKSLIEISFISDPRIQESVRDIHDQIQDHYQDREERNDAQDERFVAA